MFYQLLLPKKINKKHTYYFSQLKTSNVCNFSCDLHGSQNKNIWISLERISLFYSRKLKGFQIEAERHHLFSITACRCSFGTTPSSVPSKKPTFTKGLKCILEWNWSAVECNWNRNGFWYMSGSEDNKMKYVSLKRLFWQKHSDIFRLRWI